MIRFSDGCRMTVIITFFLSTGLTRAVPTDPRASRPIDPTFNCGSGSHIVLTKHNDGIDDCDDGFDEYDDPLLLYTVLDPKELWDPILRGFFINTIKTFRAVTMTSCNEPWTLLGAHGPYIYLMCPRQHDHVYQIWRNGSLVADIPRIGKEIQALAFDEATSNVYLLENWRIKLCNNDLTFCSILQGKLRHKPVSMAFSSKRGLLFWVERKTSTESYIVKSRRDGTQAEVIFRDSANMFEFVTIDQSNDALYWRTSAKNIYSSFFNESVKTLIQIDVSPKNRYTNVDTFAVDAGRIFWADQVSNEAQTCTIEFVYRCKPSEYQPNLNKYRIGKNIIIYSGNAKTKKEVVQDKITLYRTTGSTLLLSASNFLRDSAVPSQLRFTSTIDAYFLKESVIKLLTNYGASGKLTFNSIVVLVHTNEHACNELVCSHLCTYVSENEYACFCDTTDKKLVPNSNNGICEGVTLMVTRGNYVYIVGLRSNSIEPNYSPIIRKTSLNEIDSVSALTYDSIRGRVILTETDKQNIYTWTPGRSDPQLILQEGLGTISSLEFDDFRNIYWISPTDFSLKVTNLETNNTVVILEKNSSSIPFDFALVPSKGYMFILFNIVNGSIILERLSMSGNTHRTRKLLHRFENKYTKNDLSLHYMKNKEILLLTDRLDNEIKYAEIRKSHDEIKFQYLVDNDSSTINSVTTVDEAVIWTEADGLFRTIDMRTHEQNSAQRISLNLQNSGNGTLKIVGIVAAPLRTCSDWRVENEACQASLVGAYTTDNNASSCGKVEKKNPSHDAETSNECVSKKDVGIVDLLDAKNNKTNLEPERPSHQNSSNISIYVLVVGLTIVGVAVVFAFKFVSNKRKRSYSPNNRVGVELDCQMNTNLMLNEEN